ncbi:hypothetical protein [Symbiobacterium thermophilum]|uniref:Uncharacterized protein n=1 Tax=Symbiobacterium thermophilum (strain DSM 24528 / JCM 14929 / IAM 14863 / T) TaxID=292459 RepID=Q67QP3_SYMTH|nr:hypothetical protein [Symbiobacterium thermophilum]BAD40000.1 hypothetical protein STH1015 [Symbiobacterium thermophilum IAM 14863]
MNELQLLFQALASLLPEAILSRVLTYAAITAALVALLRRIPWFEARRQVAAPVAAVVLGQGFGWLAVGFDTAQWGTAVGAGVVIALAAVGGYSGTKNVAQHVRKAS